MSHVGADTPMHQLVTRVTASAREDGIGLRAFARLTREIADPRAGTTRASRPANMRYVRGFAYGSIALALTIAACGDSGQGAVAGKGSADGGVLGSDGGSGGLLPDGAPANGSS